MLFSPAQCFGEQSVFGHAALVWSVTARAGAPLTAMREPEPGSPRAGAKCHIWVFGLAPRGENTWTPTALPIMRSSL